MHPHKQITLQWFAAFNQHDIEMLLNLYDDNAKHYSSKLKARHPETNGLIQGKNALRSWWQDAFKRLPQLHYTILTITANDERVFMEYIRQTPNEEDMQVGAVLEFANGKIIASRVYHS